VNTVQILCIRVCKRKNVEKITVETISGMGGGNKGKWQRG
jgi:hypothetical protein